MSEADDREAAARTGAVDAVTPAVRPGQAARLDRQVRAALARTTRGLSPAALAVAWTDWAIHLAAAPGKRAELAAQA